MRDDMIVKFLFQFPSNGKAYPKAGWNMNVKLQTQTVSIPFKRESLSKVVNVVVPLKPFLFQFPSNGKAYPKFAGTENFRKYITNGFHSLQTGKPIQSSLGYSALFWQLSFQFPSNGKAYPKDVSTRSKIFQIVFQFPSNGKAYPKDGGKEKRARQNILVSIPFKRESLSKAFLRFSLFTSPMFQFPSNGKAYPKFRL